MFEKIIRFSVRNKLVVAILTLSIIILGWMAVQRIPLDAVPDITNNQVQVVTQSPTLAAEEVEQFITFPIEMSLANVPHLVEIRSISRFGLSVVTIVFEDDLPILDARQYVREQLNTIGDAIPPEMGSPELMPITTGLGEIYQYTLSVDSQYRDQYDALELRSIQDWIVKRQLMGTKGIVDVSSFGGYLKQYEVAIDPIKLNQYGLTLAEVFEALERNNQNSGGSYIEKGTCSYYIRTEGLVDDLDEIEEIVIERIDGQLPIRIREVAEVRFGHAVRYGAMTRDGEGEAVGGITLMLKGGNSSEAIDNVHDRIAKIQEGLPEGVHIDPFLDRSVLVGKTIKTVAKNLIEGGGIVILVLILLLGNLRAGLIVASVIPLSMLFAFIMMDIFGVSANLMSLGAIDFGIVVDGAVIIIEAILHVLLVKKAVDYSRESFDNLIAETSAEIYKTAAFGVLIILVVFVPIMTLTGIEGKMFRPMAQTFSFAILGAFILTLTYVPMMSAIFLRGVKINEHSISERLVRWIQARYKPTVEFALSKPKWIVGGAGSLLVVALIVFLRMGAVFIPTLEEGDLAMQMTVESGSSLSHSIETATKAEQILLEHFPEVKHVVSKIGTAEVPTDPMGIEDADIMIILKNKDLWTTTDDNDELIALMKEKLNVIDWATFEFTQPIQLRFNELITGSKADIAIKVFGEDMDELHRIGQQVESLVSQVPGAADVKMEQTEGLSQYAIDIDRARCAQYGIDVKTVNDIVKTAYAGQPTGLVYEGERRFDLVVRLDKKTRKSFDLSKLYVHTPEMQHVPISELTNAQVVEGPVQIQRENAQRRIGIGVNVRDRDVESLMTEVQSLIQDEVDLPPGYFVTYGGAFENLQSAKKRLMIAVPAALLLILVLLYMAFGSIKDAALIFSAVPLSAVGGVFALWLRGMPFSISAGVGFIALFGVGVLNGIVLIGYIRNLMQTQSEMNLKDIISQGAIVRLRPVLMTALVAMLGFLPMALSTSEGAEVQKPLATVVIGGLFTSTLLTLVVLPAIYLLFNRKKWKMNRAALSIVVLMISSVALAQGISPEKAIETALANNVDYKMAKLKVDEARSNYRTALDLGETQLNAQYGQINAIDQDWYFGVSQNFGNINQTIGDRRLRNREIDLATARLEMTRRRIEQEVLKSWINWATEVKKLNLIDSLSKSFIRFTELAEKRKASGEINVLEYSSLLSIRLQLEIDHESQLRASLEAEKSFKSLTQLEGDLTPDLIAFEALACESALESQLSGVFQSLNNEHQEVNQARLSNARTGYWPSLSLGYFNQQIEGVNSFDGFTAGVSIPLWYAPQKGEVKRQQIFNEQASTQMNAEILQYQNAMKAEEKILNSSAERLSQIGSLAANEAIKMRSAADQAYQNGEIDYLEFLQVMRSSLDLLLNYHELRGQCLVAQEQLKFYTK